jgi:hypothetical protein
MWMSAFDATAVLPVSSLQGDKASAAEALRRATRDRAARLGVGGRDPADRQQLSDSSGTAEAADRTASPHGSYEAPARHAIRTTRDRAYSAKAQASSGVSPSEVGCR